MSIDVLLNSWLEQNPRDGVQVDTAGRAGERTLLSQSFPQFPKRRPCRGEINSSKYLAAEEAILTAEGALRSPSQVLLDDAWIQDIRATLSTEPDPHWSNWPAWKELVAAAHPLHNTLRQIEISEFSHKSEVRERRPCSARSVAPIGSRSNKSLPRSRPRTCAQTPIWPTERSKPPTRAPLKHVLCVARQPHLTMKAKPPLSPWARKHFATSGGPKVTAKGQKQGDLRRTRYQVTNPKVSNLNSLLRPVTPPAKVPTRPTTPRRPSTPCRPVTPCNERS